MGETMNKTERFTVAQVIPMECTRDESTAQGLIDYMITDMSKHIAAELMGRIESGEKAVRLGEYKVIDDNFLHGVEYRRTVYVRDIVRCKYCKWFDGAELCNNHGMFVGDDLSFYCRDGERKDDEAY